MPELVITLDELAAEMQIGRTYARRTIRKLEQQHHFPAELPGLPGRWSRDRVTAWIRGPEYSVEAVSLAAPVLDDIAAERAALEARYAN